MTKRVVIVVPCFNEEARLPETLRNVRLWRDQMLQSRPELSIDFYFVNDGSTDQTLKILQHHSDPKNGYRVLSYSRNRGKGFACRYGILKAAPFTSIVGFMDADLATDLRHVEDVVNLFDEDLNSQLIVGSRIEFSSDVRRSLLRHWLACGFRHLVSVLLGFDRKDTQCGFKFFRSESALALFPHQKAHGFEFDVEILYLAQRLDLKTRWLSVHWTDRAGSTVKPGVDSLKMFFGILKLSFSRVFSFNKFN